MENRTRVDGLAVIHQGDTTSTNGTVLEGVASLIDQHHLIALQGHQVFCPACKQKGVIGQGSRSLTIGGIGAALHGYPVICGCPPGQHYLIASVGQ